MTPTSALRAEGDELDLIVAGLDDSAWALPTPAPGWTIAHQIAHLTWTDELLVLALTDPEAFRLRANEQDLVGAIDQAATDGATERPPDILKRWRTGRSQVLDVLADRPNSERLAWIARPMSVRSAASARLMETWAHGRDIADTLGISRPPTGRLRDIAHLAYTARDYSFQVNGLPVPTEPFRLELTGPDGDLWNWGEAGAAQRVTGDALDFCLLAVRRRSREQCRLAAVGPDAERWVAIAQAFAGSSRT